MAGLSDGPFIGSLCLSIGLGLLFPAVIRSSRLFHFDLILLIFKLLSHYGILIFEFQLRSPLVFVGHLTLDLLLHDLVTIAQIVQIEVLAVRGLLGAVEAPRPACPHSVLFIDLASHVLLRHLLARELEKLTFSLSSEHALESKCARVVLSCLLLISQWGESTALVY